MRGGMWDARSAMCREGSGVGDAGRRSYLLPYELVAQVGE